MASPAPHTANTKHVLTEHFAGWMANQHHTELVPAFWGSQGHGTHDYCKKTLALPNNHASDCVMQEL